MHCKNLPIRVFQLRADVINGKFEFEKLRPKSRAVLIGLYTVDRELIPTTLVNSLSVANRQYIGGDSVHAALLFFSAPNPRLLDADANFNQDGSTPEYWKGSALHLPYYGDVGGIPVDGLDLVSGTVGPTNGASPTDDVITEVVGHFAEFPLYTNVAGLDRERDEAIDIEMQALWASLRGGQRALYFHGNVLSVLAGESPTTDLRAITQQPFSPYLRRLAIGVRANSPAPPNFGGPVMNELNSLNVAVRTNQQGTHQDQKLSIGAVASLGSRWRTGTVTVDLDGNGESLIQVAQIVAASQDTDYYFCHIFEGRNDVTFYRAPDSLS